MAALNSRVKAFLGPKATASVQDNLPLSVAPDHENLEPPEDLLRAVQKLSLNNSAGEQDVPRSLGTKVLDHQA
ncbi:hypothetical protein VMCG_03112 [Cytospora schulzeri]|uniref:Uncharacterized protein n=1 Tax=Cytospora schulzeri TaxID=448051 RepID=A0A423WXJ3_9PEZI|nr:hypothetical protein VMCG_03112 [Valsa malicola]